MLFLRLSVSSHKGIEAKSADCEVGVLTITPTRRFFRPDLTYKTAVTVYKRSVGEKGDRETADRKGDRETADRRGDRETAARLFH